MSLACLPSTKTEDEEEWTELFETKHLTVHWFFTVLPQLEMLSGLYTPLRGAKMVLQVVTASHSQSPMLRTSSLIISSSEF